jgi:hypothetical protein
LQNDTLPAGLERHAQMVKTTAAAWGNSTAVLNLYAIMTELLPAHDRPGALVQSQPPPTGPGAVHDGVIMPSMLVDLVSFLATVQLVHRIVAFYQVQKLVFFTTAGL